MMKTRLAIAALVAAGLVGSPLALQAKSYKHTKHHQSSSMTTGANMKSSHGTTGMSGSTKANTSTGAGTTKDTGQAPGSHY
jgi:hypothetical protein